MVARLSASWIALADAAAAAADTGLSPRDDFAVTVDADM
jgi:hypothetical protein